MNRHLSRREAILVSVASVLCVFTVGYMFVFSPQLERISTLRAQVSQLTVETRLQHQKTSQAENHTTGQTASAGENGTPPVAGKVTLPNSADESGLLKTLYALATKSHVQVTNLDALQGTKGSRPNAPKSSLPSLHIQLVTQGSATAVESFLAAIRQVSRLMVVENLSVQTASAGQVKAQFDLYAYFTNH